jgi:hypothetical protein
MRSHASLRRKIRRIPDGTDPFLRQAESKIMFDSVYAHSTGLPLLDAQWDFRRARRAYLAAKIGSWLRRRGARGCLPALSRSAVLAAGPSRLEVVPLHAIVGTVAPTANFDGDFRPAPTRCGGAGSGSRWRIARARRYRRSCCAGSRMATTWSTVATGSRWREHCDSATSTPGSSGLSGSADEPAGASATRPKRDGRAAVATACAGSLIALPL